MSYSITVIDILSSDCIDTDGAVDADVVVHDEHGNTIANGWVTLVVDHHGHLNAWGGLENWLSFNLRGLSGEALDEIVREVRASALEMSH